MLDIYGACGFCVAGKNSTVSHGPPSSNPPHTHVGALIHADLITLRNNRIVLLSKDDHTGYLNAVKLPLGKTKASGIPSVASTIPAASFMSITTQRRLSKYVKVHFKIAASFAPLLPRKNTRNPFSAVGRMSYSTSYLISYHLPSTSLTPTNLGTFYVNVSPLLWKAAEKYLG